MQTIRKSIDSKGKTKEKTKDDVPKTKDEKKKLLSVSTPRDYVLKSSTTDIYGQKKKVQAPKKSQGITKTNNTTPMKDLLKSSPSSVSQFSIKSKKDENTKDSRRNSSKKYATPRQTKDLPFSNVTVNSPAVKKKLDLTLKDKPKVPLNDKLTKETLNEKVSKDLSKDKVSNDGKDRQRTKTRTLDENEVKVLTPDVVDNNAEMLNLSRRLAAKPKVFYVDLEEGQSKVSAVHDNYRGTGKSKLT